PAARTNTRRAGPRRTRNRLKPGLRANDAAPTLNTYPPLRGEGARRAILEYRTSFPAFVEYVSERCRKAARPLEPPSASVGTPSPLNGERAGVRGEDSQDLPCNELRCAPAKLIQAG